MTRSNRIPPPPPDRMPAFEPPRVNSIYNLITMRIRAANTIFGDRVKLFLRQVEDEQWTRLDRPYLLVVPRQVSRPREVNVDYMNFVNPREVMFIAQYDDRLSEASYLAVNDIDTGERQLIDVLVNWQPDQSYKPTLYGGMRIQSTRAPDVKVAYTFIFYEIFTIVDEDIPFAPPQLVVLDGINVHLSDPCCRTVCEEELPPGPNLSVTGGGCPQEPQPDPCPVDPCPPVLGTPEN